MMPFTLGIRLLGGFSLRLDDRAVVDLTSGRSQALLAYLVLNRQTAQSRQRIALHLWPESTDAQARANLRKELSRLRHALPQPETYLRVETKTLQWLPSSAFSLDVLEFEAATKAAEHAPDSVTIRTHLEQAIAHYQGNLLPNLEDEWLRPDRERLADRYLWVLGRLVQVATAQQDYATALTYAQQHLRADPLNESTYATLMRLHGWQGDRAKALQVYHQCLTVLREELGIDPSVATRQLYETLLMETDNLLGQGQGDETLPGDPGGQSVPAPHIQNSKLGGFIRTVDRSASFLVQPAPTPHIQNSKFKIQNSTLVGREQIWGAIQQWASTVLPTLVPEGEDGAVAAVIDFADLSKLAQGAIAAVTRQILSNRTLPIAILSHL